MQDHQHIQPSYCLYTLEPYITSFVYLHRNTYKMAVQQSMLHYKKHKPMKGAVWFVVWYWTHCKNVQIDLKDWVVL